MAQAVKARLVALDDFDSVAEEQVEGAERIFERSSWSSNPYTTTAFLGANELSASFRASLRALRSARNGDRRSLMPVSSALPLSPRNRPILTSATLGHSRERRGQVARG